VTLAVRRLIGGPSARPEARPVVVALHGGPGLDHHCLLPLARRLAPHFEVWLPDLPGHGASLPPSGRLPGLQQLTDHTAVWIRGLPVRVDALVGHSLGAWLARELLRRRRLEVRAAVLLAPPASGRRGGATAWRRAAHLVSPAPQGAEAGERQARRELLAHLQAECPGSPDGALGEMTADVARARLRPAAAYSALLRNLHRTLTGPLRPFDPGCPVLVVCGAEDRTTPASEASKVAAATAGARLEILEGLGHYPFAERPEETALRVAAFLSQALGVLSPPGAAR
jgi:pimeloyl-ACP methyl ester carboxylesterase